MVNREECVETINKFIETKNIELIVTLFEYLCELRDVTNREQIEAITKNPFLISELVPNVLEAIQREFKINGITKNNILITVF